MESIISEKAQSYWTFYGNTYKLANKIITLPKILLEPPVVVKIVVAFGQNYFSTKYVNHDAA